MKQTFLTLILAIFVVFGANAQNSNSSRTLKEGATSLFKTSSVYSVPKISIPGSKALLIDERFVDITTLTTSGWNIQNLSTTIGTTTWMQGNETVFAAYEGIDSTYAAVNFNSTTGANTISNWLITPNISIKNGDVLSFYTRTVDAPAYPDRLQVRMSTNGTSTNVGTTSTSVGDFTTLLLDINSTYTTTGYPNVWTLYSVTISGVTGTVSGRFAFRYFVENGGPSGARSDYIGIDMVQYNSNTASTHDLGVTAISPTSVNSGATVTPTVTIHNYGTGSEASYSVNLVDLSSSYTSTVNVSTAIAPGADAVISMANWTPADGSHTLRATVTVASDANTTNNLMDLSVNVVNSTALWEQTVGTTGYSSQDFETANDAYDNQAADDFTVTGGPWNIGSLTCYGSYSTTGPLEYLNIYFYSNNAGIPGTTLYEFLNVPCTTETKSGTVSATLPEIVTLSNGTYWVSIVARMDYGAAGQWYWWEATSTNGYFWMWRNPGDGFGSGYTTWTTGQTALTATGHDLTFALYSAGGTTSYTVTYSVIGSNGTLDATVDGVDINSPATVDEGKNVVFTAAPAAGYKVKEWKLNSVVVAGNTSNNYTITNLAANSTVTVEFELNSASTYEVNFSVVGGNGALLASVNSNYITTGDMVDAGEDVTFTAAPNGGYQVAQWTVNSIVQAETGNTFIYTGLDNDITVTVSFEEQIVGYNVYFGANTAGGSVTAADGTGPITSGTFVEEGQDVVFTAVADFGYQFSEWYVDDILQAETSNIFTYSNLDQTIDVRASFEVAPQQWTVNFNVVGTDGTINAFVNDIEILDGDLVYDGVNVEFIATPDPTYRVKEWTVDGTPVDGNTSLFYTLSDLNDDVTVTVEFEAEPAGETDIIAYSFAEQTGNAIINSTDHTVDIEVVYGTDLTDLVATFTLSTGATALIGVDAQESGVTSNDFSSSVTYTVNNDVNTQDWVVTVTEQKALVIFTVTDLSHEYTGFYLKGTFDENGEYDATWNFNADQGMFYDNGLAGDAVAGDYVWTYVVELVPSNNPWKWGFTDLTNNVVATNISFSVPDVNTQTQNYTIAAIGINEVRKEIVAYPNPSNGLFTITADAQYTARIFDVTGKLILVTEIDETNNQIDLSTQNKGMYFIQLIGEKDQILRVIVK